MKQLDVSDKTFDRIRDFYVSDNIKLTAHEELTRKRWASAFAKMLDFEYITDKSIIPFLKSEFNISEAQAYRDISASKRLFGDMKRSNREAMRYLVTEFAKDIMRRASSENDFDNMNKALSQIIKANNLDREDLDLPDPSKIQPPIQILQINMDFITSQFSHIIDDKAKEKINKLMLQVQSLLDKNKINDYLDTHLQLPSITKENDI